MLKGCKGRWIVAAVVLILLAAALSLAPFYAEICEKNAYTGQKECSAHQIAVFSIIYVGQVLELHAGAITGVATAILAFITWRLVTLGKEQSNTSRAELRAYLSVVVGGAVYQERARGLKFEAKPVILNNGKTPAYNVRYRARAEVLTDSVSKTFVFTAPPDTPHSQASIGPQENRILSAVLDHFVADNEIQDIKSGNGKALWVWGIVHYDDVFKCPRFTQFCQRLAWLPDDRNVIGSYDGRFSLSD
jgi:hypothetical protein